MIYLFRKKNLFSSVLLFLTLSAFGCQSTGSSSDSTQSLKSIDQKGYEFITPQILSAHLRFLSSDELEGRETAKRGQKIAARYIATQFERLGLKPIGDSGSYFQKFWVKERRMGINNVISVSNSNEIEQKNTKTKKVVKETVSETKVYDKFLKDFFLFPPRGLMSASTISGDVVFLGYGINDENGFNYSDYAGQNTEGKILLILTGEPQKNDSIYWFSGKEKSKWNSNRFKTIAATEAKAAAIFIVTDNGGKNSIESQVRDFQDMILQGSQSLTSPPTESQKKAPTNSSAPASTPTVFISSEIANSILASSGKTIQDLQSAINKNGKPNSFVIKNAKASLKIDFQENTLQTENVVALLEGSDPILKNEAVVFSGHYDHVGVGGGSGLVYNGADDDGSGTTGVLAMAEAFGKNGIRPKRSVIFITVAGEEKGLLGSDYFTQHPTFPLAKITSDINIDMIGRTDEKHDNLKTADYIYVIGSDKISKDLDDVLQAENKSTVNLVLDYTFNDENDPNRFYYRSDHYNFAKNGIPVVFFFNGTHADYHQPTDKFEKINFEKMSKIVKLAFSVGWDLSNRELALKKNDEVKK